MTRTDLTIRPYDAADRPWAETLIAAHQASSRTVRFGEVIEPLDLTGLVAEQAGRAVALLTYRLDDAGFEIVTLHASVPGTGAGSALIRVAADTALSTGAARMWLVTTNDNLDGLAFYQRQGFRLRALHAGGVDTDRHLKPELPLVNPVNGLEIHDLLELEMRLAHRR